MPDGHTLIILESEGVDQDNLGTNISKLVIDVTGIGRYYYLTADDTEKPWNSQQYTTRSTGYASGEFPRFDDGSGNNYITLNKLQYGPLIDASGNLKATGSSGMSAAGQLEWYQSQFWTRNLDESKYIGNSSRQNLNSTQQFGNEYTFPRKWDLTCIDQINFSKITYTDVGLLDEIVFYGPSLISNTIKSETPGTSLINYDSSGMNHKVLLCLPGNVKILMPNELYSQAQVDAGNPYPVGSQLQIYEMKPGLTISEQIQDSEIIVTDSSGNTVRVSESTFGQDQS